MEAIGYIELNEKQAEAIIDEIEDRVGDIIKITQFANKSIIISSHGVLSDTKIYEDGRLE